MILVIDKLSPHISAILFPLVIFSAMIYMNMFDFKHLPLILVPKFCVALLAPTLLCALTIMLRVVGIIFIPRI